MIKLKLLQQASPSSDGNTYEASAVNIKHIETFDDDVVDIYTVYWEITPNGKKEIQESWENLTTVDESDLCDWDKVYMIKLNGREQNIEDFEILN